MTRVFRQFLGLAGASIVSQAIGFAALAYVARRVGPTNLGAYNFAGTLSTYAGLAVDAGLSYKGLRDIARDPVRAPQIVTSVLSLQVLLGVSVYFSLVLLAPAISPSREAQEMLPIVGLTPLLNGLILDWPLLALGHSGAVARWRMLGQVAYGILVPFLVTAGIGGALRYAGLNALGLAVTAAGTIWAYRRVGQFSARDVTVGTVLRRARESMPFAVVLALLQVLGNMGPILLGYLVSTRSVGIFAVAYKVPTVIVSLTQMWLNAFFPYATKRTRSDAAGFARELERVLSLALVLMVMTALAGVVCANRLMPLLFGRAFASASLPFALLACSAGVVVVQACVTEGTLMAIDSQRWYVGMLVVAVPLMIALEVGLIGAFGLDGAAGAAIAINAYLAVAGYLGVRRKLGRLRANAAILVRGWLCAGTMALAMLITQEAIGLTPGIAAGALAFVVVAWLTGLPRAVLAD